MMDEEGRREGEALTNYVCTCRRALGPLPLAPFETHGSEVWMIRKEATHGSEVWMKEEGDIFN